MKERIIKVLAVLALLAAVSACNLMGPMGGNGGDSPPSAQPAPSVDAVTGMLPAADTATNVTSITLSWNAVSGATGYEVQLAETAAGVPTAPVESVATTSFDPTSAPAHFWYWRVRAVDGDEFGRWSAISSVTVDWGNVVIPGRTISPFDTTTSETDDTTPTFQWEAVPGAVRYEIEGGDVGHNFTNNTPPLRVSVMNGTSYTFDVPNLRLRNDTAYDWRIRAVDAFENPTAWTASSTFTVAWGSNGPADGFRFEEELWDLRDIVNDTSTDNSDRRSEFAGGIYRLGGDITMSSIWTPIGDQIVPFTGNFDGAGYTITGLTIRGGTSGFQGFFGAVDGGRITNVTLRDVDIEGGESVGGLVGSISRGTVSGSSVTGQVAGSTSVGGLVGAVRGESTVSDSYADVTVTGQTAVGGLVGGAVQGSTVSGSYATGIVSANAGSRTRAGGLVGTLFGSTVSNSYASATTSSNSIAGGLVGWLESGTVSRSYAIGAVSSQDTIRGGLVGDVNNNISNTVSHSFYDQTTTGQGDDTGKGDPKTTADMQDQATFTTWDFETMWAIDPTINNGYPYLRALTP